MVFKLPKDDEALLKKIQKLLTKHAHGDPYSSDGKFAEGLTSLPVGLRAMAATYWLDISLSLDDIGWHFLNFGESALVAETHAGLTVLGLPDVAAMFMEAHEMVKSKWDLLQVDSEDNVYYKVMTEAGYMDRINELTTLATKRLGKEGIFPYWIKYARQFPDLVFTVR